MYHCFAIHGLRVGCRFFVVVTSLFQVTCFCIFRAVDFIEEEVSIMAASPSVALTVGVEDRRQLYQKNNTIKFLGSTFI